MVVRTREAKPQTEHDKRVLANLKEQFTNQQNRSEASRRDRPIKWILATPLLVAPMLPLSRIALRNHPVWRDRVFKGLIGGALIHGVCLMSGFYESEEEL